MSVKLFVGNLPWSVGDLELEQLFAPYAEVQSARVITDRETGRSRGFGFVELETSNAAGVISALNGREVEGRALRVNEAESQDRRGGGGGGGRGPRGGGGGYGGGGGGYGGGGGGYGGGGGGYGDRGDRGPRNRY